MKTFLNVLYRRILYKIPLKLLLVLLAIFGLLFACSKAEDVSSLISNISSDTININVGTPYTLLQLNNSNDYGTYCIKIKSFQGTDHIAFLTNSSQNYNIELGYNIWSDWGQVYACLYSNVQYLFLYNNSSSTATISYDLFKLNALFNTQLPILTSQECQSQYNLIPISEVDSSYCQSNNLCPSGGTPSDCPNIGVSNLFINDIFHPGAFNIIMNIPEEISRDYAYTNSGYNFNLDIEGYNVDYEKMQSVIDNQSYIPTEEDFQNIISILTPYTKIIVFFVFLFIVWAWIKKPFKSKKL